MIGASRVLNRVAHDKLFGYLLHPAKIEVGGGNPIASVIISWICVVVLFFELLLSFKFLYTQCFTLCKFRLKFKPKLHTLFD